MKDEEMAEKEYENCKFEKVEHFCDEAIFVTGFLAGLKAGRPQWHKVADGDLPDNSRYVWTNVGAGYHDDDGWWDDFGKLRDVVAWCEPKFEE